MRRTRLAVCLSFAFSVRAFGVDLPVSEARVGSLALTVVPDSMVVSPDSSRLAFCARAGDATLAEKGLASTPTDPAEDSAKAIPNPIRLYLDDKPSIVYDMMSPAAFSPDSRRVGYAGRQEKKWRIIVDNKFLTQDADDVPAHPVVFSPDSKHVAWVVQRGEQFFVTVDDAHWPALDANALGMLAFSPDGQHVAAVARIRTAWALYVDGKPLPPPSAPAATTAPARASSAPAATRAAAAAKMLDRFGQFTCRPDSSGLAFYAAFPNARWQLFSQSLDGAITYTSKPYDGIMKGSPVFSADAAHLAFGANVRNKWSVIADTDESPLSSMVPYDQLLPESLVYYQPADGPNAGNVPNVQAPMLLYIAEQNHKWQLYVNHHASGDSFDGIIQGSFLISPDQRHYAFAGTRNRQTFIIKDGATIATHDEGGGLTFAFSPNSQHLAYAARNGGVWFACVDGQPGAAFAALAGTPIAFSPDSAHIAFAAATQQKTWRLVVGKDGDLQSKPYEAFLKGTKVVWRPDGTLVSIVIQKKVATRIEARP